jgi:hypothetical protein
VLRVLAREHDRAEPDDVVAALASMAAGVVHIGTQTKILFLMQ